MNNDNIIISLGNEIDKITQSLIYDGYGALASYLKVPLGGLIVIYIIIHGYMLALGHLDTPRKEFTKSIIKIGLIYTFAMNWEYFSVYIKGLFIAGAEEIASVLMQSISKTNSLSIQESLNTALGKIVNLGLKSIEHATYRVWPPFFSGILIWLSGIATIALAFIEIVIAKLMVAIGLSSAPLFIILALFNQTKGFFERWLGLLASYAFVLIFVSSVVALSMHLLNYVALNTTHDSLSLTSWLPIFMVSALCIVGIAQAAVLGKHIGGSIGTAAGIAIVAGFAASLAMSAKNMSKAAGHTKNGAVAIYSAAKALASRGE